MSGINMSPPGTTAIPPRAVEITGAGTQTLTVTPTALNLGTEVNGDPDFTSAAGVVTYNGFGGSYFLHYSVNADATTGVRSDAFFEIYVNGLGIPRSRRNSYHRTAADGEASASARILLTLAPGDTLEVRGAEEAAGDNIDVLLAESNFLIEERA